MSDDVPEPTPWGQLIRDAREAAGLSIPEAARRAGISAGQWGNIERGYQKLGKTRVIRSPGAPRTVAHMADVANLTPERLAAAGNDSAARILREIRTHAEQAGDLPRFTDPAMRRIWEDPGLTRQEKLGILALIEGMRARGDRTGEQPGG
jgi:transcriptional regulator with XRE-family HTH domain